MRGLDQEPAPAGALAVDVEGRMGTLSLAASLFTGAGPLAVVGPNGAGKTSLLMMILGIVRPDGGRIALGEHVLFDARTGVDLPPEDRRLGYVPQDFALFPHLSVLDNVTFAIACRPAGSSRKARVDEAMAWLTDLEVAGHARSLPRTLSSGERQRVALARALAARPRALLLDEPLAALDVGTRKTVRAFLARTLERLALPAIVVTHDAADALALGHTIAVIEAGRVVQTGTADELRAVPATPFVAELLGSR